MKKVLWLFICVLLIQNPFFAQPVYDDNYQENPNYLQGLKYLESSQYSSAINEFKKAIRVNPLDTSSLIGLSNSYNMRAEYYNNTVKATENAISDLKSAIFFIKYFADNSNFTSAQSLLAMEKNLSVLENASKKIMTPETILSEAKASRAKGEFAAAGYDYYRIISNPEFTYEASCGLGDIFKIFNRPDKALSLYQKALTANPDNTEIHLKLARTYEQVNDYSSSLKEYSIALDNSSEKEEILNSLERIWQKKVDENPKDAEAHANLGVVYQKQKRYQEALAEYQKAQSLNPANLNTRINIATLYQEQKNYNAAINIYDSILQMQPQNPKILAYKADCLKALKRNNEAISLYKTALNLDPKNTKIRASLFELLKDTMPAEEVLSFLYKNVQNSPMDANAYYEFAYELHKANKLDDAIVYYQQTIKMDKNKTDAYVNLAQVYRQKKNYAEAYRVMQQAQAIAPENEFVKKQYEIVAKEYSANNYNIASNAFQSGDYRRAINEYMKINPPTVDSLIGIAASYQSLSDNAHAIEYYKKAMELDNKNDEIPFYIASIYANNNDFDNAKQYIEISLNKNPSNKQAKELSSYINDKMTEGLLSKAVELYDSKQYNESISLFNDIIKINPSNANVYYYRALAYDAVNNYKKAIEDYKSTLKYAPDMYIAYYSLGVDYDSINNYQEAKENYKKYVELCMEDNDYKQYAEKRIQEIN